jgi:hypothetical protein
MATGHSKGLFPATFSLICTLFFLDMQINTSGMMNSCRAVLGSVSDYCTHHAHCTVMIVKKQKHHKKSSEHWGWGFHSKEAWTFYETAPLIN